MQISHASSPQGAPESCPPDTTPVTSIDASLARGVRRTYFRELQTQWKRLDQAQQRIEYITPRKNCVMTVLGEAY